MTAIIWNAETVLWKMGCLPPNIKKSLQLFLLSWKILILFTVLWKKVPVPVQKVPKSVPEHPKEKSTSANILAAVKSTLNCHI